jgi:hypothetical protein
MRSEQLDELRLRTCRSPVLMRVRPVEALVRSDIRTDATRRRLLDALLAEALAPAQAAVMEAVA